MMPPLDTMNTDEAFLTLVQSQRELLQQLNMENAIRREQTALGLPSPGKRGSNLGVNPFSLMNRPIDEHRFERRASVDLLRRMSIGMGNDNFVIQTMHDEAPGFTHKDTSYDMRGYSTPKKTKRRRSSFGMSLSGLLYEEPCQPQQSRRLSLLSILSKHSEVDDTFPLEYLPLDTQESPTKKPRPAPQMEIDVDPKSLKITMEGFASAMAKSAKSQQDIHNWDKKMGLKRSHSKTMRMSMKSRKRLRSMMKKELGSFISAR